MNHDIQFKEHYLLFRADGQIVVYTHRLGYIAYQKLRQERKNCIRVDPDLNIKEQQ